MTSPSGAKNQERRGEVSDENKGRERKGKRERRTLQESTVLSDDVLSFVASQVGERRRSVDDGAVEFSDVLEERNEEKTTRKKSDLDLSATPFLFVQRDEKAELTTTKNEQLKSTGPSTVLGFARPTTLLRTPNTSNPVVE